MPATTSFQHDCTARGAADATSDRAASAGATPRRPAWRRAILAGALVVLGAALAVRDFAPASSALPMALPRLDDGPPVFREAFIQPETPEVMVHVSSITPVAKDRSAAVWYAGSREGAPDVAIYYCQYDGRHWGEPRLLVDRHYAARDTGMKVKKVGNAVLFRDRADRIWLFYASVVEGGWSMTSLNYMVSSDLGATWCPSRKLYLSPFFNLTYNVKNKAMLLDDGSFLLPVYQELFVKRSAVLHVTPRAGGITYRLRRITYNGAAVQPSLIPLGGTDILATFRNMEGDRVLAAESRDTGRTWTRLTPLSLVHPNAGLDALALDARRVLVAMNDSPRDRSNLSLMLSEDRGASWACARVLESAAGGEFSYPSFAVDDAGLFHLTYTHHRKQIKHLVFNKVWLRETLR